jgi:hypothetical protein
MRFFDLSTFITEAVANVPLDLDTVTIPGNLKVIRFIDYLTTGINEDFTHEGNNAGKGEKAKSRDNGRGNFSSHIDVCNSCVNSILTRAGMRAFSDVTYEDILVPRIPREFEGTDEDVDSEWNFIEQCPSIMNNMKGEIGLSGNINQTPLFVDKRKVDSNTKFYRASLLYGYINNENALAVVSNGNAVQLDIKPRFLNLDPDMKYIDEEIESQRPAALELLKEIYSANPEDFPDVSDPKANNGTMKSDVRGLLTTFKSKIPEDGNVFLSSDEIKELLPLLQYFKMPKDLRDTNDKFFDKIAAGVSALEKSGIHFGENSTKVAQIQNTLTAGNYDIVLGYSQEGDKTHTETFGNKGEEIFVGYVTGYKGQAGDEVIPVYIVNQNPDQINKLKGKIGKKEHIGNVSGKAAVPYKKVNTDNSVKRTGGNELIFQLPYEIYGVLLKEQKEIPAVAQETPKVDAATAKAPKPVTQPKAKPVVAPKAEPKTEPAKAPEPKPTEEVPAKSGARIFKEYGEQFGNGSLTRQKAVNLIRSAIKKETGRSISADSIASNLDKKYGAKVEKSPEEIEKGEAFNFLFGPEGKNTKLAPSALPRIKKLAELGHNFTSEELDNLVARGMKRADLDKALGLAPVMEVRVSKTSYSLKALLENINKG